MPGRLYGKAFFIAHVYPPLTKQIVLSRLSRNLQQKFRNHELLVRKSNIWFIHFKK